MFKIIKKLFSKFLDLENITKEQMLLYLCSNETLPNPMEPDEEMACILKLQNGDEQAKNELIERNLRLVVYIAKKFENTFSKTIENHPKNKKSQIKTNIIW